MRPDDASGPRPFVAPLVAVSVALTVLVIGIVVVVVVRARNEAAPAPTAERTAVADPRVDPCVVGRWRVTGHTEQVVVADVGAVTFTGGRDATVQLEADGAGLAAYPDGTAYEGEAGGQRVTLRVSGEVRFDFTARDGTLSFIDPRSDATTQVLVDGEPVGADRPFAPPEDPARYTCAGNAMTQTTQLYTTELTRVG